MLCGEYCYWMLRVAYGGEDAYQDWYDEKASRFPKARLRGVLCRELRIALKRAKIAIAPSSNPTAAAIAWSTVVDALGDDRPSIIWLPRSAMHPAGHYVVAKGAVNRLSCRRKMPAGLRKATHLIVCDPARGEREMSWTEFFADWLKTGDADNISWTVFTPNASPKWLVNNTATHT